MLVKNIISWIFLFASCALLAIGRVYDERLEFFGVNGGLFITVVYLFSVFLMLFSIKSRIPVN